jgi:hypothetical protein
MPITINGLTGISGADGSAATPFISGSDADTGLYFPSAGNAAISINGTRALLVDNSNNMTMTGNVTATEFRFANGASVLSAAAGNPTGTVLNYASTTAPTGYLACDGSIYSRSSYGALANVIGTPASLSSYTAEYANTNTQFAPGFLAVANGVAFLSNVTTSGPLAVQYSGGIYTSTDGTTWTARTAHRLSYDALNASIQPYMQVTNGAFAANVSGGVWVVANSAFFTSATTPNNLQTSSDLVTWTNRSIDIRNQTGTYTNQQNFFAGIAGGGTLNRLVYLHMKCAFFNICQSCGLSIGTNNYYVANTATSDDAGATFSYSNGLPAANSIWWASIASSNAGFVISQGNTAYWSANGQYWQDISANLKTALNISNMSSGTTQLFYNSYSANGQFIIPAYGNRFLVAPSSNGSNGNWTTVGPTEGLPYLPGSGPGSYDTFMNNSRTYQLSYINQQYYDTKIVHNGQCYLLNWGGAIYYSQDLKYWFKKVDILYPSVGNGSHLIALGNKFLQYTSTYKTVFSFTANGSYTAATQFPVPRYSAMSLSTQGLGNDSSATPLVSYIKT